MSLKITHKNSTAAGTPPASGDIDVGEIAINAADAELYTKDTAGNIRKFQNTTTGSAAGVPFTQAGSGAVQRTVESKLQDVVSVKDFGAVGNGVADDTAAIQAAINSCRGIGKGLHFPAGRYKITNTLIANFNYGANYPENQVVMFHMYGDGSNATRIEWHGTTPMTTMRNAMMILEGFCSISDLTFICPRGYPGFDHTRTPYYGIVLKNTAWRSTFKNVAIKYVHVPFSAGVIKNWNPSTYELEPVSGGSALSVDFAQNTYLNCTFEARTDEFFDGTFTANSTLNANGTNLAKGTASTSDLSAAAFSDGSYAVEIAKAQSVGNIFIGCQIIQVNPNSTGTIRVHDHSSTSFEGCMIVSGYGNKIGIFCFCPTFTGPDVFADKCYFIGNIAGWSSTQGFLRVKDSDGEWVKSPPAEDIYLLCGQLYGTSELNCKLVLDSVTAKRATNFNKKILLKAGTRSTSAQGGAVTNDARIKINNLDWQGEILVAGTSHLNIPSNPVSIANNLPAALRDSSIQPEELSTAAYRCRSGNSRTNWSTRIHRCGRWLFNATIGSNNSIAPAIPIDAANGAYNVSLDIWIKLKPGKTLNDLTSDNIKCEVKWLSASNINNYVNGGSASPVLMFTGATGQLKDGSIVTRVANMAIPPTDAGWMELNITSTGTSTAVIDELGVGTIKVWDALNSDCSTLECSDIYYEQSTFTPTITQIGGTGPTYTSSGHYTRVGKLVTVSSFFDITAAGVGATQVRFSVPFQVGSNGSGITRRAMATFGAVTGFGVSAEENRPCSAFVYEFFLLVGPKNNTYTGSQFSFTPQIGQIEINYSYILP